MSLLFLTSKNQQNHITKSYNQLGDTMSIRSEAETFWKAGFSKKFRNVEAIQILLLHAQRTGINPLSLLTSCRIKQEKIVMEVETIFSLIKASPFSKELVGPYYNDDGEITSVIITRKGIQYKSLFSMEQAQDLNLLEKLAWVENPTRMRRNRALIDALRQAFPEFVVGVIIEDELKDSFYRKTKSFLKRLSVRKNIILDRLKAINFAANQKPSTASTIKPSNLKENNIKALPQCNDECSTTSQWFNSKIN